MEWNIEDLRKPDLDAVRHLIPSGFSIVLRGHIKTGDLICLWGDRFIPVDKETVGANIYLAKPIARKLIGQ